MLGAGTSQLSVSHTYFQPLFFISEQIHTANKTGHFLSPAKMISADMISAAAQDMISASNPRKRELQAANMSLEDFAFRYTEYWDLLEFGGLNGPEWNHKIGGVDCRIIAANPDFCMLDGNSLLKAWRFHIRCIPSLQAMNMYLTGRAGPVASQVYNIPVAVHVFLTGPVPQVGSADLGKGQVIIDAASLVSALQALPVLSPGPLAANSIQTGPTVMNGLRTIRKMENFYIAFTRAKNERKIENMNIYCHEVMNINGDEVHIAKYKQLVEERRVSDLQESIVRLICHPPTQMMAALINVKITLTRMVAGELSPEGEVRQISVNSINFY